MNTRDDKHIFAVYVPTLSTYVQKSSINSKLLINDADLHHRIYTVLRLDQEELILFDESQHIFFMLSAAARKNTVEGVIKKITLNVILTPAITILLPMLKREAFVDALYACVELGATTIIPVMTIKVRRGESAYDASRVQKIMIAAAEQSKNFNMPRVHKPMTLEQSLEYCGSNGSKLFCDPDGASLMSVVQNIAQAKSDLVIAVGPEGGFVAEEVSQLRQNSFVPCALTPTILRAQQAVALSLGVFRAVLSSR